MRIIAISLSKGGVGKTTTAINLAHGLALAGDSVLLIDTDTQGHVGRSLGIDPPSGLAELVVGNVDPDEVVYEARPRMDLIAGGNALAGVKHSIARREVGAPHVLSEALEPYEGLYDYIIVDTAPGWDALAVNVLVYADEVLTPISLASMSFFGLIDFVRQLDQVQKYHPHCAEHRYILPTYLDQRAKEPGELLKQLEQRFPDKLCQPIRYNIRLAEAPGHQKTIFEYDPHSRGAQDYAALVERIRHAA
jgi:chromosome partitioning protein